MDNKLIVPTNKKKFFRIKKHKFFIRNMNEVPAINQISSNTFILIKQATYNTKYAF